jgi:hypothetical protein
MTGKVEQLVAQRVSMATRKVDAQCGIIYAYELSSVLEKNYVQKEHKKFHTLQIKYNQILSITL